MKKTALYIHIPFCRSKCRYCDFASYTGLEGERERYLTTLIEEMERYRGVAVDTVFFGGGTPSILSCGEMEGVLTAIRNAFKVSGDAEVTIEANPEDAIPEKLGGFRSLGINRLSIGIQSFHPRLVERAGRALPGISPEQAVENARRAGFDNLSLDLMFALPGQGMDELAEDLRRAVALAPEHLSVYQLTPAEGTALNDDLEADRLELPDDELQRDMYEYVMDHLKTEGYEHYEVSNFARPDCQCRHNLAYWEGDDYIGLGSAAHSFFAGLRHKNHNSPIKYMEEREKGINPVQQRESEEEKLSNYLLGRLRLIEKPIAIQEVIDINGINLFIKKKAPLEKLEGLGLVKLSEGEIKVTKKGVLYLNNILLELM